MRKYDLLVDSVMNEIGRISLNKINAAKRIELKEFLCKRIELHGSNGYLFNAYWNYRHVMHEMKIKSDINLIACYVLDYNYLKVDLKELTENEKYVFNYMQTYL